MIVVFYDFVFYGFELFETWDCAILELGVDTSGLLILLADALFVLIENWIFAEELSELLIMSCFDKVFVFTKDLLRQLQKP